MLTCGQQILDTKINNAGIYFEKISQIKLTTDTFKMAIYVNVSDYEDKYLEIMEIISLNSIFCTAKSIGNVSEICKEFEPVINATIIQLTKRFNNFKALKSHKIIKRGLINAVGIFDRWAFGILNEEDLNVIQTQITENTKHNKKTADIIKLQTRVVQSTIDGFNTYTNTLNNNTIKLRNSLESLISAVNVSEKQIEILDISQK